MCYQGTIKKKNEQREYDIFKTKEIGLNLKLTELGITAQDMLHNYNLKDDCYKFTSNWPAKQPVKNTICFPTVEYSTVDLFFLCAFHTCEICTCSSEHVIHLIDN